MAEEQKDLFGNVVITDPLLRDKFIEPPFSVLDSKSGNWQNRKKQWRAKGLKSEVGRNARAFGSIGQDLNGYRGNGGELIEENASIFDPALCEILYHWFCDPGGFILDPFAGGSVRGIVANYLGYNYTGIDIRQEQIDSNREQAVEILPISRQPQWYCADSLTYLPNFSAQKFDFVFSCPPYGDLEVYSDLPGDISNMNYELFLSCYRIIIQHCARLLKAGGYACFVVSEIRNKAGYYRGFVPDTIKAFEDAGLRYYNEAILLNVSGSAAIRADRNMRTEKLVRTHQNVLVFKKPE